jgi:hypothetical protein
MLHWNTPYLTAFRKQPLFEKSGAKTFCDVGSWALLPTTPMTQTNKVFVLLFVHKKKPSFFLALGSHARSRLGLSELFR